MTANTIKTIDLMQMPQAELDELYTNSPSGAIPEGDGKGTVVTVAGFRLGKILSLLIKLLAWQGKVFYPGQDYLLNKVSPFRLKAIRAKIYRGDSWLVEGESTILDYSKTSFVAQKIRDEIREVAPGTYLGNAYWGNRRVLCFTLEF